MKEGMLAIVPYWAWDEVNREKLTFTVAEVVKITSTNDQGRPLRNPTVIIHRYGNNENNFLGQQKKGWIDTSDRNKHCYRVTKKDNKHVPYMNWIESDIPKFTYKYEIQAKEIPYFGFKLTQESKIPSSVLDVIADDEWINVEFT